MECLREVGHREYPHPVGRPGWRQRWLDLAFFHWSVEPEVVGPTLPDGLELDLFEGRAWLSVVPFRMEDVMLRGLPAIPRVSDFPELNLRTYVVRDGKPGVWFYSLDADQSVAVWAARKFFSLPYFKADMRCEADGEGVNYSSVRREGGVEFEADYRPVGEVYFSEPGTLEAWLTERYCLYAERKGKVHRGEIHHRQWPLQKMEFEIERNGLFEASGFDLSGGPELAQFSRGVDVAVWGICEC